MYVQKVGLSLCHFVRYNLLRTFTGHWVCMVSLLWGQKRMQSNYLSAIYASMPLVTIKFRLQISHVHCVDPQSLLWAAAWGWQTLQYPCFVNVLWRQVNVQSGKNFCCCKAEKIPLTPSELKVPARLSRLKETKQLERRQWFFFKNSSVQCTGHSLPIKAAYL